MEREKGRGGDGGRREGVRRRGREMRREKGRGQRGRGVNEGRGGDGEGEGWRENKKHYYLVLLYRDNCVTERGTPVIYV